MNLYGCGSKSSFLLRVAFGNGEILNTWQDTEQKVDKTD